jgi:hypothetical protein
LTAKASFRQFVASSSVRQFLRDSDPERHRSRSIAEAGENTPGASALLFLDVGACAPGQGGPDHYARKLRCGEFPACFRSAG